MGMNSRNNDMGISYKKNTLNGVFFMRKKTPKFGSLFSLPIFLIKVITLLNTLQFSYIVY